MTTTEVSTELVLTERHDGVLTITINRPAQKNAVSREVAVQLAAVLDDLDADPTLSVGVLTGAGGTFSAGMDLKAFQVSPAVDSAGSPRLWCASRSLRRSKDGRSAGASKWHWPAT